MKHHTAKKRAAVTGRRAIGHAKTAIECLRTARDNLRKIGSKNAADYVARAMKSAEGALRHAERIAMEKRP